MSELQVLVLNPLSQKGILVSSALGSGLKTASSRQGSWMFSHHPLGTWSSSWPSVLPYSPVGVHPVEYFGSNPVLELGSLDPS